VAVGLVLLFFALMALVLVVLILNHSGYSTFSLSEHKKIPTRLSDHLPWGLMVNASTVLNKNGALMSCFRFRGPDLFSATKSELITIAARFNNALKRLPAGWALYVEDQRIRAPAPAVAAWPEPVTRTLDAERREFFKNTAHFENRYFLTLIYLPPQDVTTKVAQMFYEGDGQTSKDFKDYLTAFEVERRRIENLMATVLPEIEVLENDELLTYLHSCISPKWHPVKTPEVPVYLDALLPDTPLVGGLAPRLGNRHLQVLTVRAFPGESSPGMLDAMNRLPFEYRWVTRFVFEDKTAAQSLIKSYQQKWLSGRKSFMTVIREALFKEGSAMQNTDAVNKAEDADAALQELGGDYVSYGYFTQCVVLSDTDPKRLVDKKLAVERIINSLGFTTIDEVENHNAFDAFLGSIPGNCAHNIRHPLLNTLNFIHLFPLSAVWAGAAGDVNLGGQPLMNVVTEGSTPFRLSLNYGDVGHTLIVGPTGAGKSTLLRALESAWPRYANGQVYIFDKNRSSLILSKAVGGDFFDLGAEGSTLAFQPLADVDRNTEAAWALDWLVSLVEHESKVITPEEKTALWEALKSLGKTERENRTLTGLRSMVRSERLKQVLQIYTHEGSYGRLLDADRDTLRYGRWQVFEMGTLMANYTKAVLPVLTYLFHKLERRFDANTPTLLPIDEGWLFLDSPVFAPRLREWLKTLRRFKVYLVFASQSPADVANSRLFDVIKESCFTKIFLPNPNAREEATAAFYRRFSLNERQIEIIAHATPKRDYYYTSPAGNRLFSLALGDIGLGYCAATGDADVKRAEPLLARSTEDFNREWLAMQSLAWVGDLMYGSKQQGRGTGAAAALIA